MYKIFESEVYLKAKKSLGQNFLIDKNIIQKIISILDISKNEVIEVGPGTGNLTYGLIKQNPLKLTVIEKDQNLCTLLSQKFSDKIKIINQDILKIDPQKLSKKKLIVFGNLPYNISTEIISQWVLNLKVDPWFSDLILMFQKEVADRIIARENSKHYGRLTILLRSRLNINKISDVKPNCFKPSPKVESSILHFTLKEKFKKFSNIRNLEIVTRVFFNQRRKMIKNPIKQLFNNHNEVSKKLNLDLNLRPQNLSLEMFYKIAEEFANQEINKFTKLRI